MSDDGKNKTAEYPFKKRIGPLLLSKSNIRGGPDDAVYLSRWVCEFGRGRSSIRFHVFRRPDEDSCHHDHPWWFFTVVLWGGYVEETVSGERAVRWLGFRRRGFRHRVTRLLRRIAVTMIITGPIEREWGFFTRDGWMGWREFKIGRAHV